MRIRLAASILFVLLFQLVQSQMPDTFGKLTPFEQNLDTYEKDPEANAVVLYERGDNYFKVVDQKIRLIKEYHGKIKILNEKAFDQGTIKIPLYHSKRGKEKLTKVKAVTHNNDSKHNVLHSEVFTADLSEHWRQKSFTFPKLQAGSILEYTYTIETPFDYNLTGWEFQRSIPVVYSEFNAKIPGNWVYNRSLSGPFKLSINDASLKKNCFSIPNMGVADCEVLRYVMKDLPAFQIDEDFALGASNYISSINFELSEYTSLSGISNKYTKSWKDVDKEFRSDKDIGRQLAKKGFFEKNVPEKLLLEGDDHTRANNIFKFIQKHFTWNGKYGIYSKARVKEAFDSKKGSVSEINMSLINLLNAAGIQTNLMLLSTRKSGLPKKAHPVMSDFNYCVAKVEIDGKDYLLDATDKYMAFGMLPFRALNHYGRVMDFKNESYWYDIAPELKNIFNIRTTLSFDVDKNVAIGAFDILKTGYSAVHTNEILDQYNEDKYIEAFEKDIEGDFDITDYKLRKEFSNDKRVSQRFQFELNNVLNGDIVYFNPFLIHFFDKNPFLSEERHYPVDFGYPRNYEYSIIIMIPEGYQVQELPKKQAVQLADKIVQFSFLHSQDSNQIALKFNLKLNNSHIKTANYQGLQEVFEHVTDVQNNSLVVFKKI